MLYFKCAHPQKEHFVYAQTFSDLKTTCTPEPVHNSLSKSQSWEDCAYVHLYPNITIYGAYTT